MRKGSNNGTLPAGTYVLAPPRSVEMAAFDLLPPPVREAMREARFSVSAVSVLQQQHNVSPKRMCDLIRDTDARTYRQLMIETFGKVP